MCGTDGLVNRMPNREEIRKYIREHKQDPLAKYCPLCKGKTLHVAIPNIKGTCDIICECCWTTFEQNVKGVIPYTYC